MEKHTKQITRKEKNHIQAVCKKATLAEKRAQKLTKRALAGVNIHQSSHKRNKVSSISENAENSILKSALIAEEQGERLVQRILGATGR